MSRSTGQLGVPVHSWVGSVWGLRDADGEVIGEVRAVDGDIVSLAIVGTKSEPARSAEISRPIETGGREVRVSTGSLLTGWEHVDSGRAGFWRRYRVGR